MAEYYLVADIGGTQMRAACFPVASPKPVRVEKIATQGDSGTSLERFLLLLESISPPGETIKAITVAAPGPSDPYTGILYEAPNIPGWNNMPLRKHIEDRFHVPTAIGNDANLAALGEWRFGAGQGHHHLIYITVSTGIGGGVIINDKLLLGVRGLAAELGHVTVVPNGPRCGCGQPGHLEAIASGPSIARWVREEIGKGVPSILSENKKISAKDVSVAAQRGDKLAAAALARAGNYLGVAIADWLHIFNPSAVIIGGGVVQSGQYLLDPLRVALHEHVLSAQYLDNLTLATAALGDDVGLKGALALAQTFEPA
ncbi:MAG TPA: ROK family protein [Anaerolineales bacterium]|nr:ROK family protein [Anaerolineales bacterium]